MKVQALFDSGTVKIPEDRFFFRPLSTEVAFAGAIDGVSGLYIPSEGPKLFFGRLSGGQMVADTVVQTFFTAAKIESLEEIILRANIMVREIQLAGGVPLERSDLLAGAAFVVAKIEEEIIEILQAGDCFACWELCDGSIGTTQNQVYQHDMQNLKTIEKLMKKYKGDRIRMWKEFSPVLVKRRCAHVNKRVRMGYGLFNGQQELEDCWQKITLPRDRVDILILASDGLIHYPKSGPTLNDMLALAQEVLEGFQKGSLETVLTETRRAEEKEKEKSHIDHAEASALAIEF